MKSCLSAVIFLAEVPGENQSVLVDEFALILQKSSQRRLSGNFEFFASHNFKILAFIKILTFVEG